MAHLRDRPLPLSSSDPYERCREAHALGDAPNDETSARLDELLEDADRTVRAAALFSFARLGVVTPKVLRAVADPELLTPGLPDVNLTLDEFIVSRIHPPAGPLLESLVASSTTLDAVDGLVRVARTSHRAAGIVGILSCIVEARAEALSDPQLRALSELEGVEQFEVIEEDDRGGHLPRFRHDALPPLDCSRLRSLARAELRRRDDLPSAVERR